MDKQPLSQQEIECLLNSQLLEVPVSMPELEVAVRQALQSHPKLRSMPYELLLSYIVAFNSRQIELVFLHMMQVVLSRIEGNLKEYPKHRSIKYLEAVIYEQLDQNVYGPEVRISKIRAAKGQEGLQSGQDNMIGQFVTELIMVMDQLLQIMREHFGMPRQDKISPVLFQALISFAKANQDSFLVVEDKKASFLQALESVHNEPKPPSWSEFFKSSTSMSQTSSKNVSKQDQIRNTVKREPVDTRTAKMLESFIDVSVDQLATTLSNSEKQDLIDTVMDVLEHHRKEQKDSKISRIEQIQHDILGLLSCEVNPSYKGLPFAEQNCCKYLRWMVLLYKLLEESYCKDAERRKWLMRFCKVDAIRKAFGNPFSIVKLLETQKCAESKILKYLRALPQSEESKPFLLSQKRLDQEQLAIEREMNRIRLYDLHKKYDIEPKLVIQRLTNHKRRSITFLFSGFLSEETCKVGEWVGLLNNFYDSEVYAVRWQSKSTTDLAKFVSKAILDVANPINMAGGLWIKTLLTIHTIYRNVKESPFNPAFESAVMTGEYFAEFLMANFQGYFINLVGFSLGTEVISTIMTRMAAKNKLNMLHKIYLIGGVAHCPTIEQIMSKSSTPLSIVNIYSQNDWILKYLLKLCKPNINPIGLSDLKKIQGHEVRNQDCSAFIEGHTYYRSNLDVIAKLLDMADD